MALVIPEQAVDIDITDAIPISEHKWLVPDELSHTLDTPTCLSIQPGIEQMDDPVFAVFIVNFDFSTTKLDGQTVVNDNNSLGRNL